MKGAANVVESLASWQAHLSLRWPSSLDALGENCLIQRLPKLDGKQLRLVISSFREPCLVERHWNDRIEVDGICVKVFEEQLCEGLCQVPRTLVLELVYRFSHLAIEEIWSAYALDAQGRCVAG